MTRHRGRGHIGDVAFSRATCPASLPAQGIVWTSCPGSTRHVMLLLENPHYDYCLYSMGCKVAIAGEHYLYITTSRTGQPGVCYVSSVALVRILPPHGVLDPGMVEVREVAQPFQVAPLIAEKGETIRPLLRGSGVAQVDVCLCRIASTRAYSGVCTNVWWPSGVMTFLIIG